MTKITIIQHDDGKFEIHGEVPGGVRPLDLIMGLQAHVDLVATYLKQPKPKVLIALTAMCKTVDENPEALHREVVQVAMPKDYKEK